MTPIKKCLFCENEVQGEFRITEINYNCSRCGHVYLTEKAVEDYLRASYSQREKNIFSIAVRNEYEKRNRRPFDEPFTSEDIKQIIKQYQPLDPLDKMNNVLAKIESTTSFVGEKRTINYISDYPLYHCFEARELKSILALLSQDGFINVPDHANPQNDLSISTKGYQRLREFMKPGRDSRQCFVAMWFTPEMNDVYEKAIKPAIEFIEEGEEFPSFKAVKIDTIEHVNDINDEIIGQIRRSRFMICDLTGHRGGVYFEAGFAYGLGLEVIYTCREDWAKDESLKDEEGNTITKLYDNNGKEVKIKKEGVHFDLAHRNRIEWSMDNPDDFRERLEKRIRALIY